MNYDPNLTCSGRKAKQSVTLTLQQWEYTAEVTVTVGGNCSGFDVIESAIGMAYKRTIGGPAASITLTNAADDTLHCEDQEDEGEDWLKRMVVGARIVSIEPDGRFGDTKRAADQSIGDQNG